MLFFLTFIMTMFRLKLPTDPFWVKNVVERNIPEILTDHAWCEQKAASNAISIVVRYPQYPRLVKEMIALAQEELSHFEMVHEKIVQRGYELGRERKDDYVNQLYSFMRKNGKPEVLLTDRLLFAAMVEARSCERFKVLSENIGDDELASFYHELMISEANHYTLFIGLAKEYGNVNDVDARWEEWLEHEASVITSYGKKETVHG